MTYEEVVSKVREALTGVDVSGVTEHTAIQINVTGEGEGAFYVEVQDGKVNVEPYDYFDRDVLIYASAEDIIGVAEGKVDVVNAYLTGKIVAEGDLRKAEFLKNASKEKKAEPAKKAAAKKPATKKSVAKKTADKKAPAKKTARK